MLRGLVLTLLAALLTGLAGCGQGDDQAEPSKAALACRAKWVRLEKKLDGRDDKTTPSALPQRWNNLAATVEYYAKSASGKDCGTTISAPAAEMDALTAFNTRLAPYDMELRLEQVKPSAETYIATPRSPAPSPSTKSGKNREGKNRAGKKPGKNSPKPAAIAAALKTLTAQAPVASKDQAPGWAQASVTELADKAAVAKALKDLAFLSTQSSAYVASTAALRQIQAALKAAPAN